MAKFSTWSGSFGGSSAGASGKDTTLKLSSGSTLGADDIIKNITYSITMSANSFSTAQVWTVHWYAIDSQNGSPYVDAPVTFNMTLDNRQTLTGSMEFDASDKYVFYYDEIQLYAKVNTTHNTTSFMREVSITVEYESASLSDPGTPTLSQSSTTGKCTIQWSASTLTGATGTIYYTIYGYPSGGGYNTLASNITALKIENIRIPAYGSYMVEIVAYCNVGGSSLYGYSSNTFTIKTPSISKPSFSLSPSSGDSTTLTMNNPTITYGQASSYTYIIKYSTSYSTEIEYTTLSNQTAGSKSVVIPSSFFEGLVEDGEMVIFDLEVTANIQDAVAGYDYGSLTVTADSLYFTYDGKSTIAYYDGTKWIECVAYYYTGSEWKECIPYYYDGSSWKELKAKL